MKIRIINRSEATHAFISYSQKDVRFVDKLAVDLLEAGLPITYDQWSLSPGDSLIERIDDLIQTSFVVICVISRHSMNSRWVKEELKIATDHGLPIIAVVIDEVLGVGAELKNYINTTLVANANENYLWALRQTLEALRPDQFSEYDLGGRGSAFSNEMKSAIESGDASKIEHILSTNPYHLLQLFRPWAVRECILHPQCKNISPNVAIINGQSGRYECIYVHLAETSLDKKTEFNKKLTAARKFRSGPLEQYEAKRTFAIGLRNSYGVHQVVKWGDRPISFSHLILHGRRAEYKRNDNFRRTALLERKRIDIASYDRLLDRFDINKR